MLQLGIHLAIGEIHKAYVHLWHISAFTETNYKRKGQDIAAWLISHGYHQQSCLKNMFPILNLQCTTAGSA